MSVNNVVGRIDPNDVKASFDEIYLRDDPREYFSVLGSLDYAIPDLAKPIIRQTASAWRKSERRAATILDLGSSYGVNGALFRHPLTFDMLRRRYSRREMLTLSSADLRKFDRHYFQSWPRTQAERLIALDSSAPAVNYAVEVGIADEGIAHDFERAPPPPDVLRKVNGVDMIISTGAIGYVTERTFNALLDAAERPPWVVSFCLRMFDYTPIEQTLAKRGLVTEKLASAVFVQRRFRDMEEAEQTLDILRARNVDPTGLEAEGLLFAELFVSRPTEAVKAQPLESLLTVANGRNIPFGTRYLQLQRNGRAEMAPVKT
ncbi:MAG: class I SAM-dependent methyltransferase [Hyphomonadaceae bacterium]